jgi:tRNA pseudouridine-54 N-methylase
MKKAQYSDIRAEEVRHFLRRVSRLVSSHERTLSEARRTKLFAFLLSSAKRENLSAPLPSSVRLTSTTLTEFFHHQFVPLYSLNKSGRKIREIKKIKKNPFFDEHSSFVHCY